MSGGFTADASELNAKANEVGEVASGIQECVSASDEMGVGGLVYGVLFDPTALPILSQVKNELADMIGTLAKGATGISDGLKRNAQSYDGVEKFLAQHFPQLADGEGGGGG